MKITGNTILVTGGGSGIGRGLAESLHAKGNQVVIAGRRKKLLDETVTANPGMKAVVLDIENSDAIRTFAEKLKKDYPALNVVIHNAGIMKPEALKDGATADAEAIVTTNLLGPIRLNAALLPSLLKQPNPVIMTVSSGLAFVPLAMTPTYCATKAAIHSYTQSLRYQLKDTSAQVLELIPPYVQTELMGPRMASNPISSRTRRMLRKFVWNASSHCASPRQADSTMRFSRTSMMGWQQLRQHIKSSRVRS